MAKCKMEDEQQRRTRRMRYLLTGLGLSSGLLLLLVGLWALLADTSSDRTDASANGTSTIWRRRKAETASQAASVPDVSGTLTSSLIFDEKEPNRSRALTRLP